MSGRYPTKSGEAAGASGLFTVTLIRPGPTRGVIEHWAYDDRAHALDEIGWLAQRVASGTELVLRDPEGNDLFRLARIA
ncbi:MULTISPECIES: hypothetical protein [Roseomonadaceae]|jgi:hypothetical protein|uniref:Uncharacterized protein n=1 Tax=Falsiroseomonas oleicola TaxID=2801474 RepID=A0ABS6H4C1_9PROT|nr:hypothetical protein [Roseomonas oleicola]MBU8543299.1 hypothetical protein [Roseomonas oleicola]